MAEAILSAILEQIASIIRLQCEQQTHLILTADNHIQDLTNSLHTIQSLLEDAENKQVTSSSIKLWLQDLKHIMYDADDVFDEMSTRIAISQSHNSGGASNKVRCSYLSSLWSSCVQPVIIKHEIASRIVDIKERLDKNKSVVQQLNLVANLTKDDNNNNNHQARHFTSSIYDDSVIRGRDDDKQVVISRLLEESRISRGCVSVVGIVGMGGLGKTTLAQLVYNDERVMTEFEIRLWVCVTEVFDREILAMEIIQQATGNRPDVVGWEALHKLLSKAVEGRRFLLVLDDVWTEDESYWEPLKYSLNGGAQGSGIVVTTRNKKVAKMMGAVDMHELKVLSDEECWLFFRHIAFQGRSEEEIERLEDIGRDLSKKCKGVPLAAKTLASRMRFENSKEEWRNVLTSDIWEEEQDRRGFFPALLLSYQALRPHLKQCFMYTAIFQEDTRIEKDMLVKLWMAQGFLGLDGTKELEIIGGRCFNDLSMRSFFQEFEQGVNGDITCKMHDLVREFAQFLAKTECFSLEKKGAEFNSNKVRHIRANAMGIWLKNPGIYEGKKLRTLIVGWSSRSSPISKANLFKLFHQMKCLRALDLSSSRIKELPDEVGKLLHLRYLDLSNTPSVRYW
ncbi:hypothetical protein ACHQM5_002071 [Ranunculus cassubicifolius]